MARSTPSPVPPPHDPVRNPPSADSLRLGTTVALIAHAGLIAALAFGVAWKRQEIATVSAELWSAVPQQATVAAPPPPPPAPVVQPAPPPPPPRPVPAPKVVEPVPVPVPAVREADIAREKAAKEKTDKKEAARKATELKEAERKSAEKTAEKTAAKEAEKAASAEKTREAAQQEKTAKAREDNLKRLQKQLGDSGDSGTPAPGTTPGGGTAAQSSGPSAGYAGRLRAYLKPKLVYTGRNIGSTPAVVRVRVAPDGTIVSRELIKSSGQADWDQAVLDAIDRAGIVPRDTDNRVPPVIDIPWTASER
ncbi:MAG: cell envelope integrity protein TolA [Pseudomonadota bacterium]